MSTFRSVLYVETNFLLSIAMGRDPQAMGLITDPGIRVQMTMPQVCIMESLSVLNGMRRRSNDFGNLLSQQISELRRDVTSPNAQTLLFHLQEARVASPKLLDDISRRLFEAVLHLRQRAALIGVSDAALSQIQTTPLIEDPTDNLILHCILEDSRLNAFQPKGLLTGNTKDFGRPHVRAALAGAGVRHFFRTSAEFVAWMTTLPNT